MDGVLGVGLLRLSPSSWTSSSPCFSFTEDIVGMRFDNPLSLFVPAVAGPVLEVVMVLFPLLLLWLLQLQVLVLPLTAVDAEKTDEEERFLLLNIFDVVVPVPAPVVVEELNCARFMVGNADAVLVATLFVAAAAN